MPSVQETPYARRLCFFRLLDGGLFPASGFNPWRFGLW